MGLDARPPTQLVRSRSKSLAAGSDAGRPIPSANALIQRHRPKEAVSRLRAHLHTYAYTHTKTNTHAHTHSHTHTNTNTSTHTKHNTHTHTQTCTDNQPQQPQQTKRSDCGNNSMGNNSMRTRLINSEPPKQQTEIHKRHCQTHYGPLDKIGDGLAL